MTNSFGATWYLQNNVLIEKSLEESKQQSSAAERQAQASEQRADAAEKQACASQLQTVTLLILATMFSTRDRGGAQPPLD